MIWIALPLLLSFLPEPTQQQREVPDLNFETERPTEVTLFAESPLMYNPTAMAVDAKGRVWVTEAVNYRQWDGKNPGKRHELGDRVVVLEDRDGDGKAEHSTVFAQEKDMTAALGIAVVGNRVFVSCSPNLWVFRDTDGDLVADEKEVFLTGFGGHDHDHGLHSVVEHPDGSLLWCAGNAGPHLVTDRDGWNLRSGSYYNGGGKSHPGNRPGLLSDDGRLWTGGLIGRMNRQGGDMRVLAHNFRNQYEVAVDSFGNLYTSDNDDDGNQGVRTVALMDGGNYGFFSSDGNRSWQADRREGWSTLESHWHQGDPGVMPLGTGTGAGAPCGVAVYEHDLFPEWTGHVLVADAGRSQVFAFAPGERGAQLHLGEGRLLRPALDERGGRGQWFRPSDVAVGPGGEIYVADWFDPGVGGHWAGDREAYGRILCLRPKAGTRSAEQRLQASEAVTVITQAKQVWHVASTPEVKAKGTAALKDELAFAFKHKDAQVRLTVLRALLANGCKPEELAQHFVEDGSAMVRAHAAASLRDVSWERCERVLGLLAMGYDGSDRQYLEAIGIGADKKETKLFTDLMTRLDPAKDWGRVLDFAWRLHPSESLPFLGSVALQRELDWPLRRKALDAIAHMKGRQAAEFMAGQALAGDDSTRAYAAQWVKTNVEGRWSAHGLKGDVTGELSEAELIWRSKLVREGTIDVELDLKGAVTLWLVVEDGDNGNGFDWAVWINPVLVGPAGEQSLQGIPWTQAETGWGNTLWNKSADGTPIQVGGQLVPIGLGTHAPAKVSFPLPEGVQTLRVSCAADDGGKQGGSTPSVRFAIYVERESDKLALVELQNKALSGDLQAIRDLVQDTQGALFLLEQTRAQALSHEALLWLAGPLQEHSDLSVRALASELFPLETASGEELPSLKEMLQQQGDVLRGQELFRGRGTCIACHRFEGLGGSLGPDLSAIGKKYDRGGILDSLLHPSASLAFGFDTWNLKMQDGRMMAGSILADGDSVVLRDLAGERQVIASKDIKERSKSGVSTMPSALALGLKGQALVDLASFLSADRDQEPSFGPAQELFNGRDLTGWQHFLSQKGERDNVWSVEDGVLRCEGKPAGYLYTAKDYTNFELTLEWRFDPKVGPGNSGVLMRVQKPHQVWPRSIEAQLQSGSAGDIWNIDAFSMLTDAKRTSGRHTVKLLPSNEKPLGEWNSYRIRLHGSRLTLEVNGQVQNSARWCEALSGPIGLQSEGVPIEFRNISLREIE